MARRRDDQREIAAFSGNDIYKLYNAITELAYVNLGVLADPWSSVELAELFCPPDLLRSATQIYSVEEKSQACGEIYIDLMKLMPNIPSMYAEYPNAVVVPSKLIMRLHFDRDTMPDGFITPKTVFGSYNDGIYQFNGSAPSELKERFIHQMHEMINAAGRWSTVRWVMGFLQGTVRTPPQVRYIWPAVYTLGTIGKIKDYQSLAEPSSRAALNAVVDPIVAPYLKPTYETVANSVLLGVKTEHSSKYRNGQICFSQTSFKAYPPGNEDVYVSGI
jgi:hypothetical protein